MIFELLSYSRIILKNDNPSEQFVDNIDTSTKAISENHVLMSRKIENV